MILDISATKKMIMEKLNMEFDRRLDMAIQIFQNSAINLINTCRFNETIAQIIKTQIAK